MERVKILHYMSWLDREKFILKIILKKHQWALRISFNTVKTVRACSVAKLVANIYVKKEKLKLHICPLWKSFFRFFFTYR